MAPRCLDDDPVVENKTVTAKTGCIIIRTHRILKDKHFNQETDYSHNNLYHKHVTTNIKSLDHNYPKPPHGCRIMLSICCFDFLTRLNASLLKPTRYDSSFLICQAKNVGVNEHHMQCSKIPTNKHIRDGKLCIIIGQEEITRRSF